MPSIVYACRFSSPRDGAEGSLSSKYADWITRHYRKKLGIADFRFPADGAGSPSNIPSQHKLLVEKHEEAGVGIVRHINWTLPHDTDPGLRWVNDVKVGEIGEVTTIEHTIATESVDYRVQPVRLQLGSPRVIRELCAEGIVSVGSMKILATPYRASSENMPQLMALLDSADRVLPIVMVSPYGDGSPSELDATALARSLAGIAIVVEVADAEVTWEITDELGRALSCFDGGARIYWPGFNRDDRPRIHPLFLGARIKLVGAGPIEAAIERTIFAVAASRFSPDPAISSIIRAADRARRSQQIEQRTQTSGLNWESYALELDEQLVTANEKIADLESENSNLRANQQYLSFRQEIDAPETNSDEIVEPVSVLEAVQQAQKNCQNLIFLDSAIDAASGSPFRRPLDIVTLLEHLNEVAGVLIDQRANGGAGADVRAELANRGWGRRCSMRISGTTRSTYGDKYTFEYQGKRIIFEPHVTIGSGDANVCASVHFIVDEVSGRIVIGHVGRHLPNTKS